MDHRRPGLGQPVDLARLQVDRVAEEGARAQQAGNHLGRGALHETPCLFGVGHIGYQRNAAEAAGRGVELVFVAGTDGDLRAFAGKRLRHRQSQTRRARRDDSPFPTQTQVHERLSPLALRHLSNQYIAYRAARESVPTPMAGALR